MKIPAAMASFSMLSWYGLMTYVLPGIRQCHETVVTSFYGSVDHKSNLGSER